MCKYFVLYILSSNLLVERQTLNVIVNDKCLGYLSQYLVYGFIIDIQQ